MSVAAAAQTATPQAPVRPASSAPSRSARPAPAPTRTGGPAPSRDQVRRGPQETGSTAQTSQGARTMIWGLQANHAPAAAPARPGAEARRAAGLPASLENHYAGPPAAPFTGRLERDRSGHVIEGTRQNVHTDRDHHYVTVSSLPAGLTRAQAEETFRRFNAPTTEAITPGGNGNDPNMRDGWVNPGVFHNSRLTRAAAPLAAGALYGRSPAESGGHVDLRQGTGPDGRAWAVNSTRENEHPLMGHITRTLVNEDGRYYIRTEGVGEGTRGAWPGPMDPHTTNATVGPDSFRNLDVSAGEYAARRFGVGAPPRRSLELPVPGLPLPIPIPISF